MQTIYRHPSAYGILRDRIYLLDNQNGKEREKDTSVLWNLLNAVLIFSPLKGNIKLRSQQR